MTNVPHRVTPCADLIVEVRSDRICFTYWGRLTEPEARAVQANHSDYHPWGYGSSPVKHEAAPYGQTLTTWSCRKSCD